MAKTVVSALLTNYEWAWLGEVVAEFGLPEEGKAFRCCVNFLAQTGAERCRLACHAAGRPNHGIETHDLELACSQMEWVQAACDRFLPNVIPPTKYAGAVIAVCMELPEPELIFGVIRCKTQTGPATADTQCAGAQEALAGQRQKDRQAALAVAGRDTDTSGCGCHSEAGTLPALTGKTRDRSAKDAQPPPTLCLLLCLLRPPR